jgi:hypothetical protein
MGRGFFWSLMRKSLVISACAAAATLALAPAALADATPTFPGKNGLLGFVQFPQGGVTSVKTIMPDGNSKHLVTLGSSPEFTSDGGSLTFYRYDLLPAQQPRTQRFVIPVGGGSASIFHPDYVGPSGYLPPDYEHLGVIISPDFKHVAEIDEPEPFQQTLKLETTDRTDSVLLASNSNYEVAWSADSSRIAFSRCEPRPDAGFHSLPPACVIQIANADGSGLRTLPITQSAPVMGAWSADGKWISYRTANGIHKIKADGTKPTRLQKSTGSGYEDGPIFSPDGERIAWSERYGSIWVAGKQGKKPTRVPHTKNSSSLTWQALPAG